MNAALPPPVRKGLPFRLDVIKQAARLSLAASDSSRAGKAKLTASVAAKPPTNQLASRSAHTMANACRISRGHIAHDSIEPGESILGLHRTLVD